MAKILWLVLLGAPLVGALFVLWTTIINASTPPPASPITTLTDPTPPIENDDGPLAKADRLPLGETGSPKTNTDLKLILQEQPAVVPPPPAISQLPPPPVPPKRAAINIARPTSEVTRWHWHAGSKAIKRR
jgi:hypothetical protein